MKFIMKQNNTTKQKILIYRLGSLGDTVVAIPCFNLIAKKFPVAEKRVLTNMPINQKACQLETVLENTQLVHGYIAYPANMSLLKKFFVLSKMLRQWHPDVLIYLIAQRT